MQKSEERFSNTVLICVRVMLGELPTLDVLINGNVQSLMF